MIPDRVVCGVNFRYAPGPHARRGRGAAARAVRRAGELTIDSQRAVGRRRDRQPARAHADRGRRPRRSRPSRRGRRWPSSPRRARRPSTSARASRRRRTGATSRSRSPRWCARYARARGVRDDEALPRPGRAATYPFVRLTEAGARLRAAGVPRSSTSGWASRARRRRRSSARRSRTRSTPHLDLPAGRGPARAARARSPAGSRGRFGVDARPGRRGDPDARLQGGRLPPRAGARRRPRRSCRSPPTRCTSAARVFAGKEVRRAAAARGRRLPARPRRGRADVGAHGDPVAQLPEQPDGRHRAARRSTSAPPRWRASTTSCSPPTRRTRSSTSAPSRPASALQVRDRTNVRGLQHALQALVDARLPRRASSPATRSWSPRSSATGPNVGVAPPEFIQRAAVAAWGDEAHVDEVRERLPRQARRAAAGARGARAAPRGRRRDVLPVARGRRRRRARRGCSSAGVVARAGRLLRPGRERLPAARARADARGVRARRPRRSPERRSRPLACSAAFRPPQVPVRGTRLDRAGLRVAAEQQAVGAAQLARLDHLAVGQRDAACRR